MTTTTLRRRKPNAYSVLEASYYDFMVLLASSTNLTACRYRWVPGDTWATYVEIIDEQSGWGSTTNLYQWIPSMRRLCGTATTTPYGASRFVWNPLEENVGDRMFHVVRATQYSAMDALYTPSGNVGVSRVKDFVVPVVSDDDPEGRFFIYEILYNATGDRYPYPVLWSMDHECGGLMTHNQVLTYKWYEPIVMDPVWGADHRGRVCIPYFTGTAYEATFAVEHYTLAINTYPTYFGYATTGGGLGTTLPWVNSTAWLPKTASNASIDPSTTYGTFGPDGRWWQCSDVSATATVRGAAFSYGISDGSAYQQHTPDYDWSLNLEVLNWSAAGTEFIMYRRETARTVGLQYRAACYMFDASIDWMDGRDPPSLFYFETTPTTPGGTVSAIYPLW